MSGETDAQVAPPTDVGARLRAAREARQLSVRQIADATKISVGALEAIEENDVARLPGGIFTRGFVRAYAVEVGLDPEQTMRDFVAQSPADETAEGTRSGDRPLEYARHEHRRWRAGTALRLVLVGVPVAALLVFFGIWGLRSDTGTPAAPSAAIEPEPAPPPLRLDPPVRANPPTLIDPVSPAPLRIVLNPREDCWVSLTVDGETVVRRVMQAGERESYEADDEIVLNIGDAGAFRYAINQQDGRALGAPGEVVTVRITPENYRTYVAP